MRSRAQDAATQRHQEEDQPGAAAEDQHEQARRERIGRGHHPQPQRQRDAQHAEQQQTRQLRKRRRADAIMERQDREQDDQRDAQQHEHELDQREQAADRLEVDGGVLVARRIEQGPAGAEHDQCEQEQADGLAEVAAQRRPGAVDAGLRRETEEQPDHQQQRPARQQRHAGARRWPLRTTAFCSGGVFWNQSVKACQPARPSPASPAMPMIHGIARLRSSANFNPSHHARTMSRVPPQTRPTKMLRAADASSGSGAVGVGAGVGFAVDVDISLSRRAEPRQGPGDTRQSSPGPSRGSARLVYFHFRISRTCTVAYRKNTASETWNTSSRGTMIPLPEPHQTSR